MSTVVRHSDLESLLLAFETLDSKSSYNLMILSNGIRKVVRQLQLRVITLGNVPTHHRQDWVGNCKSSLTKSNARGLVHH